MSGQTRHLVKHYGITSFVFPPLKKCGENVVF